MSTLDGSFPSLEKRILSHSSIDDLVRMLIECRKEKDRIQALYMHSYICACGLDDHRSLSNYLIPLLVDAGAISEAQQVFDKMLYKYGSSWNSLIYGYTKSNKPQCAFDLYARMRDDDSVHPSGNVIVALFKACTKLMDLEQGLEIHASISKCGLLEKDPFVGTSLVDMYAKCGAIAKAREIFEQLPARDVISWTTLIAGYVEAGHGEEALQCFQHMEMEGFFPDSVTLVCILKACNNLEAIEKGKQIHIQATKIGSVDKDAFICSTLIDMYTKFGLLSKAQQVFDEILVHDTISWTTLIRGYFENEQGGKALKCFEQMQVEGIHPDSIAFVCSLKACGCVGALVKLLEIHSKIAQIGLLEKDLVLANTLIGIYVKFRLLDEAREVFDKILRRDVVSWTVLISGYTEEGDIKESIECFERMQLEGIQPNAVTYIYTLKTCSTVENIEKIQAIHAEIERKGLFEVELVGTTLVDTYAKCGMCDAAEYVFDKLPIRDVVSWTTLITGYTELGYGQIALECFNEMRLEGVFPSNTAFTCILKACGSMSSIDKGQEVHEEVESLGLLEKDIFMGTTVVDMYLKCGHLVKAQEAFDKLQTRDVITWNTLISGYVEHDRCREALECYEKMHLENIISDPVTFVCVLKACGKTGTVDMGRDMHVEVEKKGLLKLELALALFSMYAKCGMFPEAWETFVKHPVHEVGPWNSVITVFAEQGYETEVVKCLKKMDLDGVSPDSDTFLCILKGCSSIGLKVVSEVELLGASIHTALYGRFQLLAVAECLFDNLQVRDVASWTTLISAYNEHGDEHKSIQCFEQMQIEGVHPSHVTLICSLKAFCNMGAIDKFYEIHSDLEKRGMLESNVNVSNNLVHVYSQRGDFATAHQVFERILTRDAISWTSLITGYSEHGHEETAITFLNQMQIEGITPDAITYICCLKACGNIKAIERAEDLLAETKKGSLLGDHTVCSTLIALYAKCAMHGKALEMFQNLSVRDVVAWSALQSGYNEYGFDEKALDCFEQMQLEGVSPDVVVYVCSLKSCGSMRALDKGREIHSRMEREGVIERDTTVGSVLIEMYGKCNAMVEAQDVFDKISVHDAVVWTTLVGAYAENGFSEETLMCIEHMQLEGSSPDAVTFAYGLKTCASIQAKSMGQEIHALIERYGLGRDVVICKLLVDMYAKFGCLNVAQILFDELPSRDLVSWTALLSGYAEHGLGEKAIRCFELMLAEDVSPDITALICCLKACGSVGAGLKGQELHNEIERVVLDQDICLRSALMDMYGKCGMLSQAQRVFDKLPIQDVVSWTTLIEAYSEHEYNEEVLQCLEQMRFEGISPDEVTLVCCLKACSSIGAVERAQEIHAEIEQKGFLERGGIVGNTLVDTYAKSGLHFVAQRVFDRLSSRDVVSWNSLIGAYAQHGESEKAFYTFDKMLGEDVRPDQITFLVVFNACSRAGLFKKSQMYFEAMSEHHGIVPSMEHHHGMISLLCHVGLLDKALTFIKKMPLSPNLVVWHTILVACRDCGNEEIGKLAFENALRLDGNDAASYVLMSHIYARV